MNLRQLSNLVAVADCGNITHAAARLNISQPALTKSIRDLETALGVVLFDREPRGVRPTPGGESLIAHARTVLAELQRATADLSLIRDTATGNVLIGAAPAVVDDLLPRTLVRFLAAYPDVNVAVTEGTNQTLVPALRTGALDMIVGPLSPDGPDTACTEELLYYNELAIFARAGHPLAKPDTAEATLAIADLAGQQWILPPRGTAPRSQLENAFRRAGLDPPASAVETSSMSCVRALLLATDRLTVLPAQIVRMEREMGLVSVLPVKWQAPSRPIGITARLRGTLSEAASAFIGCLHETAQQGGEVEVPPP
tara:strand:+ start:2741 stop:3676 length:936 start_codon:yes stop_codon:yes gene_type:complete